MRFAASIVVALSALACQQNATSSASAFVGANDLALVDHLVDGKLAAEGSESIDRFLFVTSTNTNELRVLDLDSPTVTGAVRRPISAPNPLETLSIPVLDRPTTLSLDTRYEGGARRKGALLYVTRQGGAEFSIVGVERSELREVRRIPTAAPITALTNLMADAQTSRVWLATFDGANAAVIELVLPASAGGLRARTTASLVSAFTTRLTIAGESVSAMLAVPGLAGRVANGRPFCADPAKACLVISTRRLAGAEGTTSLIDPSTLESVPLAFQGPVRGLATSDRAVEGTDGTAPGAVIFGVLDEEACGSPRCGGVAAIDARQTTSAGDFGPLLVGTLQPRPIRWNDGLVRGLSIVGGGRVRSVTDETGIATLGLLGVLTMSNGEIVFFDGLKLSLLDQDPTASALGRGTYSGDATTWLEGPKIVSGTGSDAELAATIVDGRLRSQRLTVAWKGALTPLSGLPLPTDVSTSFVAQGLAPQLAVGDTLTFLGGAGCADAVITGLAAGAVQFSPSVAGCRPTAVVPRAGPSAPYVISGAVDGLLGRARSGSTFSLGGLVIPFGTAADTQPPATGVSWSFDVVAGLAPMVSAIDTGLFTVTTPCPTSPLQLPGAVVYEPVRQRVFLSYPSANLVAEFDPLRLSRGGIGPNEGVACHR